MKINLYLKKKLTSSWFAQLQEVIRYEFEKMESDFGKKTRQKPKRFEKNFWKKSNKKNEGGGTYYIMKNGLLFDSVGINFSKVSGTSSPQHIAPIFMVFAFIKLI